MGNGDTFPIGLVGDSVGAAFRSLSVFEKSEEFLKKIAKIE